MDFSQQEEMKISIQLTGEVCSVTLQEESEMDRNIVTHEVCIRFSLNTLTYVWKIWLCICCCLHTRFISYVTYKFNFFNFSFSNKRLIYREIIKNTLKVLLLLLLWVSWLNYLLFAFSTNYQQLCMPQVQKLTLGLEKSMILLTNKVIERMLLIKEKNSRTSYI